MEPIRPYFYWNQLGRQLKVWRHVCHISDAHAFKLLKLWLGYEFTDLMDEFGRIPVYNLNEVKLRLCFRTVMTMLDHIRKSQSFILVGNEEGKIMAVFSPLWHQYEPADGMMLSGSCKENLDAELHAICAGIINNNLNNKTTVGNSGELVVSLSSGQKTDFDDASRDSLVRRQMVKDYFRWMMRQTDLDHKSLVDDMRYRVRYVFDRHGKQIDELTLDEEGTEQVLNILIEKELVTEFAKCDNFFKPRFMSNPGERRYWMKNFVKKCLWKHVKAARNVWKSRHKEINARAAHIRHEAEMQHRPLSPHEWQDSQGVRWYMTPDGNRMQIPAGAEPRPTETSTFNYIKQSWQETNH